MQSEKIKDLKTNSYGIKVTLDPNLATPAVVFPPDDRTQVRNTTVSPYNNIGLVTMYFPNGKAYAGTGTLVNENHVLTCAHNLYSADDGGYATKVSFFPGKNGAQEPYGEYRASRYFIPEEYADLKAPNPNAHHGEVLDYTKYAYDYGVIQLKGYIDRESHWGIAAAQDDQLKAMQVNITGYPGDKPEDTMWGADGTFNRGISEEFLFYTISTYEGESGSGVNGLVPGFSPHAGRQIVGVHVAGSYYLGANFAVRLTQDKVYQILSWMND